MWDRWQHVSNDQVTRVTILKNQSIPQVRSNIPAEHAVIDPDIRERDVLRVIVVCRSVARFAALDNHLRPRCKT